MSSLSSSSSEAAASGSAPEVSGFEGPEKRIEINFAAVDTSSPPPPNGMRSLPISLWHDSVKLLNGSVLCHASNEQFDSYLISESSLFVFPLKVIILTCGRTTPLACLSHVIAAAAGLSLHVEWLQYSRKNFTFPLQQPSPHRSFQDEVATLKQLFPQGSPYVLGPLDGDHWYVFLVDMVQRPPHTETDQMLNVYMHDIAPATAQLMHASAPSAAPGIARALGIDTILHTTCDVCCRCVRRPPQSGAAPRSADAVVSKAAAAVVATDQHTPASPLLNSLRLPLQFPLASALPSAALQPLAPSSSAAATPLPSALASAACSCRMPESNPVIQDYVFAPCGWSMNGMWGDVYWTMHVTPESQCSYASLETNVPVGSYSAVISHVIDAFKPRRFQTIQFIDDNSHLGQAVAADASLLAPAVMPGYTITNVSVNQYGPGYVIQMVHYVGL